jgi:hypothetical protein
MYVLFLEGAATRRSVFTAAQTHASEKTGAGF